MQTFFLVFSNPVEGKEAEYKDWYTNVHLREVVAIKGFKSAQLFRLTNEQAMEPQTHKYCAMYQVENDDVAGTVQRVNAAVPTRGIGQRREPARCSTATAHPVDQPTGWPGGTRLPDSPPACATFSRGSRPGGACQGNGRHLGERCAGAR